MPLANFRAFAIEFSSIGARVRKNGDEPAGFRDQTIDGPRCERERFAGLAAPQPALNAIGAVVEGFLLVRAEDCRLRRVINIAGKVDSRNGTRFEGNTFDGHRIKVGWSNIPQRRQDAERDRTD
jgi:hypothetical protein